MTVLNELTKQIMATEIGNRKELIMNLDSRMENRIELMKKLDSCEEISFKITRMESEVNSDFISVINVEHSWHSSNVDALDVYDIVESEITTREAFENILLQTLNVDDYKYVNGHIHLKSDFEVVKKYLTTFDHFIMDYLEYYDTKY